MDQQPQHEQPDDRRTADLDRDVDPSTGPEAEQAPALEDVAADLSLAIVSEATAMTQDDAESLEQSDENLRDVVREQLDQPLDPQQEEVVATLGAAGGSLAAGLSVALADARGVEPRDVLQATAKAVLAQRTDSAGDVGGA